MKNTFFTPLILIVFTLQPVEMPGQAFDKIELGFEPGEIEVLTSPQPEDLKQLIVPRYRGLLRLGKPNSYGLSANPRSQEIYRTQKERSALLNLKKTGIESLFELMEIQARKSEINLKELSHEFQPAINARTPLDDPVRTTQYWSGRFKSLAPQLLTPRTLSKYWCKDGSNCIPEGSATAGYLANKKNRPTWGGGTDEFTRLRAWQAYVNTEVPKLLDWSAKVVESEAFFVGTTYLREYDFNYEGFVLDISVVEPKATQAALIVYPKKGDANSFFARTTVNSNVLSGKLIKMSPDKAEALLETIESQNPRNREIYYVYKAKVSYELLQTSGRNSMAKTYQWIQEPVSNNVEFFLDETLQQKLLEVDFSE